MLGRAHTVLAAAAIALIPLVPLGLWVYAKAATVDRTGTVARNYRVFRGIPRPSGAEVFASHSYPLSRWNVDGSMVPVTGYRTEFFVKLPRSVPLEQIYSHYEQALRGWQEQRDSQSVLFERGHIVVSVTTAETARGGHARQYAVYVSQ